MSKICPLANDIMLYTVCVECEDKEACKRGEFDKAHNEAPLETKRRAEDDRRTT